MGAIGLLGSAETDRLWRNGRQEARCQLQRRGAALPQSHSTLLDFTRESLGTIHCTREREREREWLQSAGNCPSKIFGSYVTLAFSSDRRGGPRASTKYFYRGLTFSGTARTHKKRSGVQQRCVSGWAWLHGSGFLTTVSDLF